MHADEQGVQKDGRSLCKLVQVIIIEQLRPTEILRIVMCK